MTGGPATRLTPAPDDPSLPGRFRLPPFDTGDGTARGVLLGTVAGREVVAFDLAVLGYGQTIQEHRYGVVATRLPVAVPRLELQRTSGVRRLLQHAAGGDDLTVGDADFDRAFRVSTDTPDFAADVLVEPVRAWLLDADVPRLFLDRADLVVALDDPLTPASTQGTVAFAAGLLDRVPAAVWERAGGRPDAEPLS